MLFPLHRLVGLFYKERAQHNVLGVHVTIRIYNIVECSPPCDNMMHTESASLHSSYNFTSVYSPPFLLVTAWRSIIRLQINGSEPKEIVKESNGGIIAVDYHYR